MGIARTLREQVVTAEAMSGRSIEVLDKVPSVGEKCHFDRPYTFVSLGDFATRPTMSYILTSNDDKATAAEEVMWRLTTRVPVSVYLNFRSERHISQTGASGWLRQGGWIRSAFKSTVSTGVLNGPYSGPVYWKQSDGGAIPLMGSNCAEGSYFVFVESRQRD